MLWETIKKTGLVFIRNPHQTLLLVGLPLILIVILGISLGSFMNDEIIEITAKVGLIEHTDEDEQLERFIQDVEHTNLPEVEQQIIIESVREFSLISILKNDVLNSMGDIIEVDEMTTADKVTVLKDDSYAAIIEVPTDFTLAVLNYMFFGEGEMESIIIHENNSREIGANVVKSVIHSFEENVSLASFASKQQIDPSIIHFDKQFGEKRLIGETRAINSKEYYTIGMAVMNVLFVASAISLFAFLEKQSQVFNRIIISNVSRWTYFTGIFLSAMLFAFLHLLIVFGFSWLVFKVSWPILPFFVVTAFIAMAVGGLAVLLTAVTYRLNSESAINFFGTVLVGLMAFMGGSFFPLGDLSDIIGIIGNYTPNGAGMTVYMSILRGEGLVENGTHLIYLGVFTLSLLMIAVLSFPKRGQTV